MLEGLQDYPLISDESHSEYEDQLADEAWDAWLRDDMIGDLEAVALEGWEITDGVESELRTAYYAYEENEWYCESATNIVNGRHDDAMAHAALTVLGWDYPKREAKRKARADKARQEADARHAAWQAECDDFRAAWRTYLTEYPLPWLEKVSEWTMSTVHAYMRDKGLNPLAVSHIRAYVRQEAEHAAYRDAATLEASNH